jgi:hypothetical protein
MAVLPPTDLAGAYQNKPSDNNILQIKLTWVAPTGSDAFDKYFIYRNDVKIAEVDDAVLTYLDETPMSTVNYVTYYVTSWKDATTPIESVPSVYATNYSLAYEDLIARLRKLLMDEPNDPRMKRWTDDLLLECLNIAIGDVNTEPPRSAYTFETLPSGWQSLVLTRAKFEAWTDRAGLEVAKEFSFGWGGVSVTIDRSGKYLAVSAQAWTAYNERLHKAKLASVMFTVGGQPGGIVTSDLPFKIRTYAPRQYRVR